MTPERDQAPASPQEPGLIPLLGISSQLRTPATAVEKLEWLEARIRAEVDALERAAEDDSSDANRVTTIRTKLADWGEFRRMVQDGPDESDGCET